MLKSHKVWEEKKVNGKKPNMSKINATEARQYFGKIIQRAYLGSEHLIIEKNGLPVVVILSFKDYEDMRKAMALQNLLGEDVLNGPAKGGVGAGRIQAGRSYFPCAGQHQAGHSASSESGCSRDHEGRNVNNRYTGPKISYFTGEEGQAYAGNSGNGALARLRIYF